MKIEELHKIPKWAGIYCIKNNINNKCYIGQAIMLKKRLQQHLINYKNNKYDNPLYRAFSKYGLENFSIKILEEFKGLTREELKIILDEKEKYYIEKYNSYGKTGYNQTKGGDGGILGYKMTEEQKKIISKNSKEQMNDGRCKIYCYNIENKFTYMSISLKTLNTTLKTNLKNSDIRNLVCRKKYILARDLVTLENKKNIFNNKKSSSSKFISKLTEDMIKDLKQEMPVKDFLCKYNVCKKTYYNYRNKIR